MTRAASDADAATIRLMLEQAGLPTHDLAEQLQAFVVVDSDAGVPVAVGGLELLGRQALLRSVVVDPAWRGRGLAREICDRLEADAARAGVESIFLLTETAAGFFAARGYREASRDEAPASVAKTRQFAELCPAGASLMRREL